MINSGPYRNETRPYNYGREDMHQAVLSHTKSGYDGLNYVFYPFDLNFWRDEVSTEMREKEAGTLQHVTNTFNAAGFHVHAYEWNVGGFSLWVERMYIENRWGDREVNRSYSQTNLPLFEGDVKND